MSEKKHVLLVEDSESDARLAIASLNGNGAGHTVRHCQCLSDAIKVLREVRPPFDAILLDLGLPDSKGLESITEVRATAPIIPLIVYSSSIDAETTTTAIRLGADDVEPKIGDVARLSITLACAVARHEKFISNPALVKLKSICIDD